MPRIVIVGAGIAGLNSFLDHFYGAEEQALTREDRALPDRVPCKLTQSCV